MSTVCITVCEGDLCNTGAPAIGVANPLLALHPFAMLLLAAIATFLMK